MWSIRVHAAQLKTPIFAPYKVTFADPDDIPLELAAPLNGTLPSENISEQVLVCIPTVIVSSLIRPYHEPFDMLLTYHRATRCLDMSLRCLQHGWELGMRQARRLPLGR